MANYQASGECGDHDGFHHHHKKEQKRSDHLAACPADAPHPALAAFGLIHQPGHEPLPFQEQALRTMNKHRPEAWGKTS
jgi:hypothetical protein